MHMHTHVALRGVRQSLQGATKQREQTARGYKLQRSARGLGEGNRPVQTVTRRVTVS